MADLLVKNGIVLTVNETFEVIPDGAIAITDGRIEAVGETDEVVDRTDADRMVDAAGKLVFPGLITSHVHVSDILLRGVCSDRDDWLYNVKIPGVGAMEPDDHALGSALYCTEAVRSGITTFVENAVATGSGYSDEVIEAKLDVYETAGIRNVYAQAFRDRLPSQAFLDSVESVTSSAPSVNHVPIETTVKETDEALSNIEDLIRSYHGTADGRQSIWPTPYITWSTTKEGFRGAYELADKYDVMTTTHVSQAPQEDEGYLTSVEHLRNVGYLGERTLLGHCIHLSERDIRILSETDTRVAHNPLTNLYIGRGFAPVPTMLRYGVTVGLGTDNTSASNTVNMINDLRYGALIHKASYEDPGATTARKALEMATIDNARAIGREDDLGSIEPGKLADIVVMDLDYPHLTPHHHDIVSALVYQAQGFEVETVICNGEVVLEHGRMAGLDDEFPDLRPAAAAAAERVIDRAGLEEYRAESRPYDIDVTPAE